LWSKRFVMPLDEACNPGLADLKSADNRGEMLDHVARRRDVLSAELIYVVDKL
jgi:hypothetical protein